MQVGAIDQRKQLLCVYNMRHYPCILNYHVLPFTVALSPFRKCQTSMSKLWGGGAHICGRKMLSHGPWDPTEPVYSRRGPGHRISSPLGDGCFRNGSFPPLCGQAGQGPRSPEVEGVELVSDGSSSVSLLHPHSFHLHLEGGVPLPGHLVLTFPYPLVPVPASSASSPSSRSSTNPCPPCL